MKSYISIAAAMVVAAFCCLNLNAQPIISEYVEGSGFNKCIEVYNPTGASIDLGTYGYRAYHNGSATPTFEFTFPAVSLGAGQVYVICHPSASLACNGSANLTSTDLQFNGDDAVTVWDTTTGNDVDIFGSIGQDPGSRWTGSCGHETKDQTLRRNGTVTTGVTASSTGFPTLCSEWSEAPNNDCSNLGTAPEVVPVPRCNPIISQYVEGTGFCKFLEIYNPCCNPIDLSQYEVNIFFNACTGTNTIPLSGLVAGNQLASGDVIVLYNPNETCSTFPAAGGYPLNFFADNRISFNGNDAVTITRSATGANVDIFGNICENVVWEDTICGASTQNQTLVRDINVCEGVSIDPATDFPTLCSEWDTLGTDVLTGLGSHVSNCLEGCGSGLKRSFEDAVGNEVVAFPNPFAGTTTIRFSTVKGGATTLKVYSMTGAQVATLFNTNAEAGQTYEVNFDAQTLPAGTYIYRLNSGEEVSFGKLFLTR